MKTMMMNVQFPAAEIARNSRRAVGLKARDTPGLIPFAERRSRDCRRFQRAARMSEPCFFRLDEIVRPHIRRHEESLASQVVVVWRFHACASCLDVCAGTDVSAAILYDII